MSKLNRSSEFGGAALPDVPGLSLRPFRGELDFPEMARVFNASCETDDLEMVVTAEDVEYSFAHAVNFDPARDTIFAEVDGQVVGYGRIAWRRASEGGWVYPHEGFVLPAWRCQGIGHAMLGWLEERGRQIAAPQSDGSPQQFQSWASGRKLDRKSLLVSAGYTVQRIEADMVRPDMNNIPDAALPAGIDVRPVRREDLRVIFDAENEATREHSGRLEQTDADFERFAGDPRLDASLWRVAWAGNQVIGMVRSYILDDENQEYNRLRGYTEHISVRVPWRRQGIARALLCLSLQALKARGMQEAALAVHTDNHNQALRLYEDVGFRVVAMFGFYRKPVF